LTNQWILIGKMVIFLCVISLIDLLLQPQKENL